MINLLGREFLVRSFFLFTLWICRGTPFWPAIFSAKNSSDRIVGFSIVCNKLFFFFPLLPLRFSFISTILIIMYLGVELFRFLPCVREVFSHYFFKYVFRSFFPFFPLSLFLLGPLQWKCYCTWCPKSPVRYLHFFFFDVLLSSIALSSMHWSILLL